MNIMFRIPKIDDYLKILTNNEVKDFALIKFSESTREELYSKLSVEQNLGKVTELLYIFVETPDEVGKYAKIIQSNSSDKYVGRHNIKILNLFDPELQLIITKSMIKEKLKEMLSDFKNFIVQTILL